MSKCEGCGKPLRYSHATKCHECWCASARGSFELDQREMAMSLEEVASALGVTKQRVGQLERRALAKVRAALGDRPDLREWLIEILQGPEGRTPARATMTRRYN